MKYGYVRSKEKSGYSIERQINALKEHNVDEIVIDSSGNDLEALIDKLQAGDTIYVESAERLTRDTHKMMEIIDSVKEKAGEIYVGGKPFQLLTLQDLMNM